MLVLAIKVNEKIIVYLDNQKILEIAVTELNRSTVRLGFDAPQEVRIWREKTDPHNRRQDEDAA